MKNVQLEENGVRSSHGEKVTIVLWEVQFPLTEETTLDFPLAQGSVFRCSLFPYDISNPILTNV